MNTYQQLSKGFSSSRKPQAAKKQAETLYEAWNGPGRSGRGEKGKDFRVTEIFS